MPNDDSGFSVYEPKLSPVVSKTRDPYANRNGG